MFSNRRMKCDAPLDDPIMLSGPSSWSLRLRYLRSATLLYRKVSREAECTARIGVKVCPAARNLTRIELYGNLSAFVPIRVSLEVIDRS